MLGDMTPELFHRLRDSILGPHSDEYYDWGMVGDDISASMLRFADLVTVDLTGEEPSITAYEVKVNKAREAIAAARRSIEDISYKSAESDLLSGKDPRS
jgi:hypothetical protein